MTMTGSSVLKLLTITKRCLFLMSICHAIRGRTRWNAKLHNLIAECDNSCITIMGDFNANVKTRANFAVLLEECCKQFSYVWTSCQRLLSDTYTYVSYAWGSQSWLDNCISTEDCNDIITNAHVVYELQLTPDVEPGASHDNAGIID